jgi:hypothetical protein
MVEIAILVNTRIVVISKAWMCGSIGVRGTGGGSRTASGNANARILRRHVIPYRIWTGRRQRVFFAAHARDGREARLFPSPF